MLRKYGDSLGLTQSVEQAMHDFHMRSLASEMAQRHGCAANDVDAGLAEYYVERTLALAEFYETRGFARGAEVAMSVALRYDELARYLRARSKPTYPVSQS